MAEFRTSQIHEVGGQETSVKSGVDFCHVFVVCLMSKIYVLVDPDTGEIRYIGRTSQQLSTRLRDHIRDRKSGHKKYWIDSLRSKDLVPRIVLLQEVMDTEWPEAERYWISYFRSIGCPLTNMTNGGDGNVGCQLSDETRAKMRRLRNERGPISAVTRAKTSASMLGHHVSAETRAKMQATMNSPATRSKISKSQQNAWVRRKMG